MPDDPPLIVLTRPEPQASAFLARLRPSLPDGTEIVISPVLDIRPIPWTPPQKSDFAIVTSANAVPALSRLELPAHAPVFCVGRTTAAAVADAGYTARAGAGTVDQLIDVIADERPPGIGVYLRGRHVSADVVGALGLRGVQVCEAVVYDQLERALTPAAVRALTGGRAVVVPLFSARTARLVGAQVNTPGPCVHVVAMSGAVAEAWSVPGVAVTVAAAPDMEAMAESIMEICRAPDAC